MGDLSLPCFAFAKQLSMAPNDIAESLKEALETNEIVEEINSTADTLTSNHHGNGWQNTFSGN